MTSTEDCVKQLTRMKVDWRSFLVVMRNLVLIAGVWWTLLFCALIYVDFVEHLHIDVFH